MTGAVPQTARPVPGGQEHCPDCGAPVPVDPRYPAWCAQCEWNLDPTAAPPGPGGWAARFRGRLHARRDARSQRDVLAGYRAAQEGRFDAPGRVRLLAAGIVVGVHGVTLALLIGASILLVLPGWLPLRLLAALLLLGIVVELRPRFGRLPAGARVLTPAEAPSTFAFLDELASSIGARPVRLVVVTAEENASYGRVGLRRTPVLMVGLALWNRLTCAEKVALLGHELGHDVNGDLRRLWPLWTATDALAGWARLLTPPARVSPVPADGLGLLILFASWVVRLVLAPVAVAVWLLARASDRVALRGGQPAEYRADRIAARVAGTQATLSVLRKLLLVDQSRAALRLAANRGDDDVWAAHRQLIGQVPEREIDRQERIDRRGPLHGDSSHPPLHLRMDLLQAGPAQPAAGPVLGPAREAAVDRELLTVAPTQVDLAS